MDSGDGRLEGLRQGALYFTMVAAVLAGAAALARVVAGDDGPHWLRTADNAFVVATMAGGVLMGVLYAAHRISARRRA